MRWSALSDGNLLAHCLMHHAHLPSGSPPPGLPTCLVAAGHADVSVGGDRMEVDCKIEQQVKRDPAGKRLNGSAQHIGYQH